MKQMCTVHNNFGTKVLKKLDSKLLKNLIFNLEKFRSLTISKSVQNKEAGRSYNIKSSRPLPLMQNKIHIFYFLNQITASIRLIRKQDNLKGFK